MNFVLLIFAASLFLYSTIAAQDSTQSVLIYTTDSVLVESTRYTLPINEVPFSIDYIDRSSIENIINPNSLDDLLHTQPGIFIGNRSNLSQGDKITIRGIGTRSSFGTRGIKILLDGIPLTFTDGQSQLNNLDIDDIENIEILKGPSSVLYGNSLGGTILITSKKQIKHDYTFKPKVTLGSFGFSKLGLNTGVNFGENFHVKLNVYSAEQDGFRKHSASKYYGINLISSFRVSERFSFSILTNYFNSPYLLNPSTLNKTDSESNPTMVRTIVNKFGLGKKVNQLQSGLVFNYMFNKNSKFKSTIYFAGRSLHNSIPGRFIKLKRLFGGLRSEFSHKSKFLTNELIFLAGIDFENQSDERQEFKNEGVDEQYSIDPKNLLDKINYTNIFLNQDENVTSLGIFSNIQYKLTEALSIFAGIRFDDFFFDVKNKLNTNSSNKKNEITMNNWSYMLGYNFRLSNNFNIYSNLSSGFQTPTTNELSNNPFNVEGFNPQLKPEKIYNFEVGIKGWLQKLNLYSTLSIYYMKFNDMIISYETPQEITYYRNAGKANNIGTDIQLEYSAFESIKLISSYSHINFKFTDYMINQEIDNETKSFQLRDKYLPGIPKNRFSFSVNNNFNINFYAGINFNWIDQYYTNDFNGPLPESELAESNYINDSYFKLNLYSNYSISFNHYSLKLNLAINNVFNERYNGSVVPNAFSRNFFEPAPGRSYFFSAELVL